MFGKDQKSDYWRDKKRPPRTKEWGQKLSKSLKMAHNEGRRIYPTHNIKHKEETKEKIRSSMLGKFLGSKSPLWLGGSRNLRKGYSDDWTETLRRSIRERDNYSCRLCGKSQGDKAFSVHHIDYNKSNCNPDNLITLCKNCHSKTNHNYSYWTKHLINIVNNLC